MWLTTCGMLKSGMAAGASDSEPEAASPHGVTPAQPGQGVSGGPRAVEEGRASWQIRSLERPSLERASKKKQR